MRRPVWPLIGTTNELVESRHRSGDFSRRSKLAVTAALADALSATRPDPIKGCGTPWRWRTGDRASIGGGLDLEYRTDPQQVWKRTDCIAGFSSICNVTPESSASPNGMTSVPATVLPFGGLSSIASTRWPFCWTCVWESTQRFAAPCWAQVTRQSL
jgi:hypothetical protein